MGGELRLVFGSLPQERGSVGGLEIAVQLAVAAGAYQRPAAAQAQAARAADFHLALQALRFHLVDERLFHAVRTGGEAAGGRATTDTVLQLPLPFLLVGP